jgi:hypothetical protein
MSQIGVLNRRLIVLDAKSNRAKSTSEFENQADKFVRDQMEKFLR